MQFGIGILIKTSMSYGGVYKLQIFSRKKQEEIFQFFLEISTKWTEGTVRQKDIEKIGKISCEISEEIS